MAGLVCAGRLNRPVPRRLSGDTNFVSVSGILVPDAVRNASAGFLAHPPGVDTGRIDSGGTAPESHRIALLRHMAA
jgi:hypothetical protein